MEMAKSIMKIKEVILYNNNPKYMDKWLPRINIYEEKYLPYLMVRTRND